MSHADNWKAVNAHLQLELVNCKKANKEKITCVACYFRVSVTACQELMQKMSATGFRSGCEQRYFLKDLLPRMAGKIEYYRLVHYYELFRPTEHSVGRGEFYRREMSRLAKFIEQHQTFVDYYTSNRTDLDDEHFTTDVLNENIEQLLNEKGGQNETYFVLAARFLALREFQAYVKRELQET